MNPFPVIDLHQDLLAHLQGLELFPLGKQTDFSMLENERVKIVVATAFPLPPQDNYFDPITNNLIEADFRGYISKAEQDPRWMIIRSAQDVQTVLQSQDTHGILMHVEGLNVVDDTHWERLQAWYDLGWRSLGPVWNLTNPLGGGTQDSTTGLTDLGRKMLAWLQERRMMVDFAHMNAPTFWEAADIVRGPLLVSHGNACALCRSPRNYTDEQLRLIKQRNGIVGVFFANTYVVGRGNPGTIKDVTNHIDHLVHVMGIDHVGLGTDFGGIITGLIVGLHRLSDLPNLWNELLRRGYATSDLEKIAWKNAARVLTEIL